MKSDIHLWLYTLFACGCITSMILFLMPDDRSRQIAELGCSCIMILALMMPLTKFNLNNYLSILSTYSQQVNEEMIDKQEAADEMNKSIIEERFEEYILKEAESQEIKLDSVSVVVVQNEDATYIPDQVFYRSDDSIPIEFKKHIETQLGVSVERQKIYEVTGNTQ